jgi:hypothetical protein
MAKKEMFCSLGETYKENGDFIPKGTPVRVITWSPDDENLMRVEAVAYVYADSSGDETQSFVGGKIFIDVNPESLTFMMLGNEGDLVKQEY